ncbi:autotransporter domain-containing protein, partial [Fusobacterium sp. THCT1E2]
ILQAGDITYAGSGSPVSQNTVINGNIDMKVGDDILTVGTGTIVNGNIDMGNDNDTLTIEKGSIINGTLDGGSGDDILNFNPEITRAFGNNEINVLHNISDFETINIDSNVTFFEKTAADDGSLKNLTISGVNEINISAGSVLNLRIDSAEITSGRYEGHALFGNAGLIINGDASKLGAGESITESENGIYNVGVLNLITNGLGLNSIIAMDGITLDEDLFTKTNSILDKAVILKTDEGNGKAGDIKVEADKDIFREVKASSQKYEKLNDIYNGIISSTDDNFIALKNIITINSKTEDYT